MFTTGDSDVHFSPLRFTTVGGRIQTLEYAYSRYHALMFTHAVPHDAANAVLNNVNVNVKDRSEAYPQLETDESYTLDVTPENGIQLNAETVYGAIRGLETLSQLIYFDFDTKSYAIPATPIHIEDAPRYAHRGNVSL